MVASQSRVANPRTINALPLDQIAGGAGEGGDKTEPGRVGEMEGVAATVTARTRDGIRDLFEAAALLPLRRRIKYRTEAITAFQAPMIMAVTGHNGVGCAENG